MGAALKLVRIGITVTLFVIGLYYSFALANSINGGMFGYAPPERWNIDWAARYALLVSGTWCLCAAALRALWDRPARELILVGAACFLAGQGLEHPGWWGALGLTALGIAAVLRWTRPSASEATED
jgi:hypothetical protein